MKGQQSHWPGAAEWKAWLRFLLMFYVTFLPAYFLTPYLAGGRSYVLAFNWEAAIPAMEIAAIPYLSIIPAFLLPLFLLPSQQIRGLVRGIVICTAITAIIFIALPTRAIFAATPAEHGALIALIRAVDVPGNLFPSLHVAYGTLIVLACAWRKPKRVQLALYTWLAVMAASTVFVHQHHIADIVAGALIGLAAWLNCRPAETPPQPASA